MMDEDVLVKFRKICGLLGSAHDGERATAASMANDLLSQHGMDWSKIGPVADPVDAAGAGRSLDDLTAAVARQAAINEWQQARIAEEKAKTVEAGRALAYAQHETRQARTELARVQAELEKAQRAAVPAALIERLLRRSKNPMAELRTIKAKVDSAVLAADEAKRVATEAYATARTLQQEFGGGKQ